MENKKMTIGKLLTARKILWEASNRFPIKAFAAYKVMKFCKALEDDEKFYSEKMQGIINKYAAKDGDGNPVTVNGNVKLEPSTAKEAQAELRELDDMEIDVPNVLFDINDLNEVKLTAADMYSLADFITEG